MHLLCKKVEKLNIFFKLVPKFFLARRILLGVDKVGEAVALRPIGFQCAGVCASIGLS